MFKGKTIILGVSSSIAAYKAADLTSTLVREGADVHVLMTENAKQFINPITFETLTRHKCLSDPFDRDFEYKVEHVELAKAADLFLVAPATANLIGKLAGGIADDMLTTTALACTCPMVISPAMNTRMYENLIVQDNLKKLTSFGYTVIEPETGRLACEDVGKGKFPSKEILLAYVRLALYDKKDLKGRKVLVTAGPTQESIDPVRFVTNHSSGKMGYAIAAVAAYRGADVTLVSGPVTQTAPPFVHVIPVTTAREMYEAVIARSDESDIVIKAAAVADYRPEQVAQEKMKKHDQRLTLAMEKTTDILAELGARKRPGQKLCGFSMETEHTVENARGKLEQKNLDLIAANNLRDEGAGFGTDTNRVTLITKDREEALPLMTKEEVADCILDALMV